MDCHSTARSLIICRTMWNGFVQLNETVTNLRSARTVEQNSTLIPILKEIYRLYWGAIRRRRLSGVKFVL